MCFGYSAAELILPCVTVQEGSWIHHRSGTSQCRTSSIPVFRCILRIFVLKERTLFNTATTITTNSNKFKLVNGGEALLKDCTRVTNFSEHVN